MKVLSRNPGVDILKLILCFMVVAIHTGVGIASKNSTQYVLINGIFRIAVPIFYLISGYYFYSQVTNRDSLYAWTKKIAAIYAF